MADSQIFWNDWARKLQLWGIDHYAGLLLEAADPVRIIFAQLIYSGGPLMASRETQGQWQALAHILEDRQESRQFAAFLRQEEKRWTS